MKLQGLSVSIGEPTITKGKCAPRLSAAIIIPSLYLIARTLVPVISGCLEELLSDPIIKSCE